MAHLSETVPELVRTDDVSVGVNLAWRLETLIQTGRLAPGARLPGLRELAAGAGVNMNTVRSIYRRLEQEGLAIARQGSGTFVSPRATVAPALEEFAARAASEALAQGIDPRELARALYVGSEASDPFSESAERSSAPRNPEEERGAREALRGQIARLEARLVPYQEAQPASVPAQELPVRPRLVSVDELVAIRDDLIRRLKGAQADAERRAQGEDAARAWREAATSDPSAHRWEAVSAGEMGEPGCGRYQVRPAWGPVGALMDWWRVRISSGCP